MTTFSATSLIVTRRFSITIFCFALKFSPVVGVLGYPELTSSLSFSRPLEYFAQSKSTTANATVNISSALGT